MGNKNRQVRALLLRNHLGVYCAVIGIAVIIFFLCVEFFMGSKFFKNPGEGPFRELNMIALDDTLGWRLRSGSYDVFTAEGEKGIQYTLHELRGRDTGGSDRSAEQSVFFLGGSFVFGQGLDDDETLSWKFQENQPDITVRNYGVMGYGTYQTSLYMKEIIPKTTGARLVIYGLIQEHEERNVAAASWVEDFVLRAHSGKVRFPYIKSVDGMDFHSEIFLGYPYSRAVSKFVMPRLILKAVMQIVSRRRERYKDKVLEFLLLDMDRYCREQGVKFSVLILQADAQKYAQYSDFVLSHGINFLQCPLMTSEYGLPGDGHPNADMNNQWAECVSKQLGRALN
ncbi:MAG: hypothetical protein AB7S78_13530 [Candidatus Omnitrophota bacterium]